MKGAVLSLPGTHPARLPGANGLGLFFPTNKLAFTVSNLKMGLLAPKRGLEVEDWGVFGLMCPARCLLGAPTAAAWGPCSEPESGMWSPPRTLVTGSGGTSHGCSDMQEVWRSTSV